MQPNWTSFASAGFFLPDSYWVSGGINSTERHHLIEVLHQVVCRDQSLAI